MELEQRQTWRILEKRTETSEVVTLVLEPESGQSAAYRPGQYLSLIREINGQEVRRAYSFSSCPGVDVNPAITVKRVPNGLFSNWLVQEAKSGDRLLTGAPVGRFLLPEKPPGHLFFLAAGSGITPILSQLKYLLELRHFQDTPVTLFYASRNSKRTIFKSQIDQWIQAFPDRFSCTYFFSREKLGANAVSQHLGNALLEKMVLERLGGILNEQICQTTHFYLCAPKALMRMAQMTLRVLDFPDENIHQETFQPETRISRRTIDKSKTHQIVARNSSGERISFEIFAGETILSGALRQGIALPYTCKTGVCFTCLARCQSGIVDVSFVEQTRREGPGALINTCIGYPVSEEVILVYD